MTSANVTDYVIADLNGQEVGRHRFHHLCKPHWEDLLKFVPPHLFTIQAFTPDEDEVIHAGQAVSLLDFLVELDLLCACGQPLHYLRPETEAAMRRVVRLQGAKLKVTVGHRSWLVPRHYLALHGLRAEELPALGFQEV